MTSARLEEARTWYFEAASVTRHESLEFDPIFFKTILDARTPTQINSIRKADTICFSAHATDTSHAAVQGFIHANGKISRGTVARWLAHPAVGDINWTPVKDSRGKIYTAHPVIQQFLTNPSHIYYLKPPDGVFNNRGRPRKEADEGGPESRHRRRDRPAASRRRWGWGLATGRSRWTQ